MKTKNIKILLGSLALVLGFLGIFYVLSSEHALTWHPKGIIARSILDLITTNFILMFIILIPTYLLLFWVVWKYCIKDESAPFEPSHTCGPLGHVLQWGLPTIIVAIMAPITWKMAHELNPYKPIESDVKPLKVQVVALNWKWLFIYPEQEIATLNYFHIPAATPIHLQLTADNAPMNSFWIPQLSGQIYSMPGMTTQLYLMADGPGVYRGHEVEINGEGYSDMTFSVKSMSEGDFEEWVKLVKTSEHHLTANVYQELKKPYVESSLFSYAGVEKELFQKIVKSYMYPMEQVL
jgi:cytochrome o ubiquinol oxidase subunit 2